MPTVGGQETARSRPTASKSYGASVQVPKALELVANEIRRKIIRGEIEDGEALPPEAELMGQFHVSRPTLREALRVLESENIISVRRGARGGATAHAMTSDLVSRYAGFVLQSRNTSLADVYQARIVFEPACVAMVAERHTAEDLAVLRATLDREHSTLSLDNDLAARVGFHHQLIALSGNQTLALLTELIGDVLIVAAAEEYRMGVNQAAAVHAHSEVIDLIAVRDAEGSAALWRTHLEATEQRVLARLGGEKTVLELLD